MELSRSRSRQAKGMPFIKLSNLLSLTFPDYDELFFNEAAPCSRLLEDGPSVSFAHRPSPAGKADTTANRGNGWCQTPLISALT